MTEAEKAAFIRKLRTKCDELACEYFDKSDDLAAVSFRLQEVVMNRIVFAEKRDKAEAA